MFVELWSVNESLSLQVIEKAEYSFAYVHFLIAAGVVEAALLEDISESDDGNHLLGVSDDFKNATQDIGFDGDIHASILLVGHVEKFSVTRQDLTAFNVGSDFPKRRNAVKVNDCRFFAVDSSRGDAFAREKGRDDFVGIAAVVFEVLASVRHVNGDLSAHELIDSVIDGGTLVFAGIGVVIADFACDSAVEDRGRGVAVLSVPFAETAAKDSEVELVKRLRQSEIVVVVDSDAEGRKNIAELTVIAFLADFQDFALLDSLVIVVVGEVEEPLRKAVVGENKFFCGIDLNVFHRVSSFTEKALSVKIDKGFTKRFLSFVGDQKYSNKGYFFSRHKIRFVFVVVEVIEVFLVAGLEAIVSGVVEKKAIVIGALPILEAFEVDLARLLFLGLFNALAELREVIVAFEMVHKVELKS